MSTPVFKPLLPPRAGYVEVVDEAGNHVYKPISETSERQRWEEQLARAEADAARVTNIENAIERGLSL